jgi:hypothetical protein
LSSGCHLRIGDIGGGPRRPSNHSSFPGVIIDDHNRARCRLIGADWTAASLGGVREPTVGNGKCGGTRDGKRLGRTCVLSRQTFEFGWSRFIRKPGVETQAKCPDALLHRARARVWRSSLSLSLSLSLPSFFNALPVLLPPNRRGRLSYVWSGAQIRLRSKDEKLILSGRCRHSRPMHDNAVGIACGAGKTLWYTLRFASIHGFYFRGNFCACAFPITFNSSRFIDSCTRRRLRC